MSDAPLDAAARALARRLLADLPADRPRTRADVDLLPAPVARLLHARLDARAAEATALPASTWIDAESDGVREATQTWRQAVRDAVRVPADVWAPAVEDAARLAVAHLVRPAETLAAYAFEGEAGPLPAPIALARTRAFGPYGYLPEIAGRYIDRKEIGRIDRYGLELLLRRIDRRMVSPFGPAEWAELLDPLVALVGPDGDPEGTVPADLLRVLFREKDVYPRRDLPEAASADQLREWLDDVFASEAASPQMHAPETSNAPPDEVSSDATPEAVVPEPESPETDDPTASQPEYGLDVDEEADHDLLAHFGVTPPDELAAEPDEVVAETDGPADEPDDIVDEPEADPAPASTRAPEAPRPEAVEEDPPAVPVIGSRYNDPADAPVYDSDVLGAPRPVEPEPPSEAAASEGSVIFPHVPDDAPTFKPEPPASEPTAELASPSPTSDVEADNIERANIEADDDETEEPLWMRLARSHEADAPPAAPEAEPSALWMQFATPADAPEPPDIAEPPVALALDALEARVLGFGEDDERRAWFVADLFRASPSEYHHTLAALDACRSYTEATQVIEQEVFRKHRINPYTDAAVAFVDALQAQFTTQGRG